MKHLIEFPLEAGGTVMVEVDEIEIEGGVIRAARPGEIATKAMQTFEAALETIKPAAATIIAKLHSLLEPPDQIGVEFGIKLSADAKAHRIRWCGSQLQGDVDLEQQAMRSAR